MANEALLESAFRRIHATRMSGIPILNPKLEVEALGFRDWNGMRVGVLVTPWSINLVVLREFAVELPALRLDERRNWNFPSGGYEFMGGDEPECGPFDFCSLFSPALEFPDQGAARAVAESVMVQLFEPPGGLSRRALWMPAQIPNTAGTAA
ncbi:MAG TPA: [NiFe]-hydrogenase assembly chaperone HybE [Steroidobacteraceae bacterium]|nr:[NiFe]-hydrogenase assembly chaperone HybE [Steroidobacteraceae bacterium]